MKYYYYKILFNKILTVPIIFHRKYFASAQVDDASQNESGKVIERTVDGFRR